MQGTRCYHCDVRIPSGSRHCPRCERRQPEVDELVGEGLLRDISMGRHSLARLFGKVFVALNGIFLLVALYRASRQPVEDDSLSSTVFLAVGLGYCAYEIWAFTHGRATSIDSYRHEATPDRTSIRLVGLLLDIAVWYLCMRFIKSW